MDALDTGQHSSQRTHVTDMIEEKVPCRHLSYSMECPTVRLSFYHTVTVPVTVSAAAWVRNLCSLQSWRDTANMTRGFACLPPHELWNGWRWPSVMSFRNDDRKFRSNCCENFRLLSGASNLPRCTELRCLFKKYFGCSVDEGEATADPSREGWREIFSQTQHLSERASKRKDSCYCRFTYVVSASNRLTHLNFRVKFVS